MRKLQHLLLSAFLLCGILYMQNVNAQTGPCGWTLQHQVLDTHCHGQCNGYISVTPSVNWPDFEYLWSNGSTGSILTGLCAGDYTVTVTDNKTCSQQFTITVNDPAPLVASCVVVTNESAPGAADGSIQGSVAGGYGPYYFQWQTNPVQSSALISNLTAGVYTLIVIDEKNCQATTSCEIITEKKEVCEGFRTQTQGGWGQCHQNGNNPGSYLAANFAGAFPAGLTIGCNNQLKLNSSTAVCTFLPSGTSPKALPSGTLTDPGTAYKNVFAGQLVAATLNVGFDLHNPAFSSSDVLLEDMIIASGMFQGWTMKALLIEANSKIGGCGSPYSYSQLSDALAKFNENYVDGSQDNGFLVCPDKKEEVRINTAFSKNIHVQIFPNPTESTSNIQIYSGVDTDLQIDILNTSGQKLSTLINKKVMASEVTNVVFDATKLSTGIYFIRVITNENVQIKKVLVNK